MSSVKTIIARGAVGIAAVGFLGTAAQAGVVVKSSGPSAASYPVGKKLDDAASVTLRNGDSITVLTDSGTRVITGPGTHRVGARGASKRAGPQVPGHRPVRSGRAANRREHGVRDR